MEQELDFKEIVDHLVDGVYVTDGNAVTMYVNPAYVRNTGISPEDIIGRSVADISREGVFYKKNVSEQVIKTKSAITRSGLIRNVDGKSISGQVTGVPVLDEDGNVKMVIVSVFAKDAIIKRRDEIYNYLRELDAVEVLESYSDESGSPMIGRDAAIMEIRRTIATAAPTDVTILITGESGVGKEIVAEKIFNMSNRRDGPYIKVNCAAIPANLLESELFGYEKGAFTGAKTTGKAGLFELANHGTILLDEIGDLPIELQTKLLRALQEKEIMRIGAVRPISLDVRVIAATNSNLRDKIQKGKFREDLYYRLSVVPIHIPPLRQRPTDIDELVKYYFNEYCKKHGRSLELPEAAYSVFKNYSWPGNVRELQNVIEYLVIFSENNVFPMDKLSEILKIEVKKPSKRVDFHTAVAEFEKNLIEQTIKESGGIRKAAANLGLDASTVSRKAKKYGIKI